MDRSPPGSPRDLLTGAFPRSCKQLLYRTLSGSFQDLLKRTCTRSRFMSRAFSARWRSGHALGHLRKKCAGINKRNAAPETRAARFPALAQPKCTWKPQKNNFAQKFTRMTCQSTCTLTVTCDKKRQDAFYAEICRKNAVPQKRAARFVRACQIKMHMDMGRELICTVFAQNAVPQTRGANLVRACGINTHMGICGAAREQAKLVRQTLRQPAQ